MNFTNLRNQMNNHFQEMSKDVNQLFFVNVDNNDFFDLYLNSFTKGTNEVFRERREYDCQCCKSFIKRFGNVVKLKDGKVTTIWDFKAEESDFQPVLDALNEFILSKDIAGVFVNREKRIGTESNKELLENGKIHTWHHFYVDVPNKFITAGGDTINSLISQFASDKTVLMNSLEEITEDAIETVLELSLSKTLYKGIEWVSQLKEFLELKKLYSQFDNQETKNLFCWEYSVKVSSIICRMKNVSIGVLLSEISEGTDLEIAVKKYENVVAPENYKRTNQIYTKRMLENAKKKIQELGYEDSLRRRFANIEDITANNILFINRDSSKSDTSVFDEMEKDLTFDKKKLSKVHEIHIKDFIYTVLPTTRELELLFENTHVKNLVSITAPEVKDSKNMFKWNNSFGWSYKGNITDSTMKERVKSHGGKVDGVLRFSIQWNDLDTWNEDDLDAHCIEPNGNRIYYSEKNNHKTTGNLDVDIIRPESGVPAVENITWSRIECMEKGKYKFLVHNFSNRSGKDGFKAEIEFNGEVYEFEYRNPIPNDKYIEVAEVDFDGSNFTLKPKLPHSASTIEHWNIKTNTFIPVSVTMYSPNYWDEQSGIGNRHYMFMLKDCINNESPNSFYNEFLKQELMTERKTIDALASKLRIKDTNNQLSGVGFSETKRDSFYVRVKGKTQRIMKVNI
jgi:hypothetical protein